MVHKPPIEKLDPVKELANLKFQGQKLVLKPRVVMRVLNTFLRTMEDKRRKKSDIYIQPKYSSTLDKNSAAVVTALLKEIVSLYNSGKITRFAIPKDKKLVGYLTAAVKTDVSVRGSLKRERRIVAVAAAPVKWKKPIERDFVYDVTIRSPGGREAFTYRVGADTKIPTINVFKFDSMKKKVAGMDVKKLSVTRGNTYVSPSEFKQLMRDGKIERVRVVKQKTS